jgi:hypothetical protein
MEAIMRRCPRRALFLPLFLFGFLPVLSCAPSIKHYPQINQCLLKEDYASAHKLIRKNKKAYPKRNAVLYHLDEGVVSHFAGRYDDSNESFSKAESRMEELYTKSLSKQAASFVISDNTIPYRGEDFERAMVNLFMALNYAGLGDWEDALVEARKVDNTLTIINNQYEEGKKNIYKEDGFIRFLMGVLYEADGELNDAFISYRKAEEIYRTDYLPNYGVAPPGFLIEKLLAAAQAMDFERETEEIRQRYPEVTCRDTKDSMELAEVFFIHYNGLGPEKVEESFAVTMPDGFVVKIAYPTFMKRRYRISQAEVTLRNAVSGGAISFPTVLMEDISSIAGLNLENRINRIKAKAILRATTKYLASKQAEKSAEEHGGVWAGLLVKMTTNVAAAATEQADVRHWRLLPAEIRVGRALIPSGSYSGNLDFVDPRGAVHARCEVHTFSAKAGEKKFFMFRTLE